MAGDVVAFAVQTLGNLLVEEAWFLNGVGEQVRRLQDELQRLKCFLKDAEVKQHDDTEMIRNWRLEIRDAAYDAEDCIERFLLKQKYSDTERNGLMTILCQLVSFWDEAVTLHRTRSKVEEIRTRLSRIATSMRDLKLHEPTDREASLSSETHKREKRETFAYVTELNLVAIDKAVDKLAGDLVDGSKKKQFRVLSICGMGGLGKTTHAKQIFHHNSVRRHFERFAWVYVSQNCRRRHVWQEMFLNLSSKSEKQRILDMTDTELAEELHKFLKDNKCLVVFDDIWSTEAWDLVSRVFPHETESQMILTSRIKDVATYADPRGILYEPSYLNDDESWDLLRKVALPQQDFAEPTVIEKMEELGKQMVKRCGGLPLGITVLGGLLATKSTVIEWQSVHSRMKSVIAESSRHKPSNHPVLEVLALSFEYLPPHLKQCFLYFAHIPEGRRLHLRDLRSYCSAEGMVVPSHVGEDATVEDVVDSYLEELVKRNMVLSDPKNIHHEDYRKYHLHDMMRDVCLQKAQEERFVRIINLQHHDEGTHDSLFSSTNTSRRLTVHLGDSPLDFKMNAILRKEICLSKSRSLIFIHKNNYKHNWVLSGAMPFKDLSCLRVLKLSGVQFQGGKLPKDVGNLIHLRTLCLSFSNVIELPSSIGNLKLMENLDLFTMVAPVYIPNVLWKMRRLRLLKFPSALTATTKLELGSLTQLQTLCNFHFENCNPKDLMSMTALKRLVILFSFASLDLAKITLLSTIRKNRRSLGIIYFDHQGMIPAVDVTQMVSSFRDLSELELFIKIKKLPEQNMFPKNILSLTLSSCELQEDPFTLLEKLPYLGNLELYGDAFVGAKLVCSKKGFPQLHSLLLSRQENVEEWVVEEEAMPLLSYLAVSACRKLKMLPDGLKFVKTLQKLKIQHMKKSFKDNLAPGGPHFHIIQNVPSVVFGNCEE